MHIAIAGGVGGAKLVDGLARQLSSEDLLVVVNTGDDFEHLGLRICPDLDTVMYTLGGIANPVTGWGVRDETWSFMDRLEEQNGETWFRLGDRDLETHKARTAGLAEGRPLSDVTRELAETLGLRHPICPATDDDLRTIVHTRGGPLAFQDYFVRQTCRPEVLGFEFQGADKAHPSPPFAEALARDDIDSVIICPSNPYVSIGPVFAIPAVREALRTRTFPVAAISPIIGGVALKGPAAKMMQELGHAPSALSVAIEYDGLIDGLVIDRSDAALANRIEHAGPRVLTTETIMRTDADRDRLAAEVIAFTGSLT